ncbi:hypothetical protein K431DRAFT_298784 [Polychaeton citri CBS 116435]|uniref:Uncharacterized protein n=1 Tax=Polychaeton citri CBS 116435 TaxID=1314669 RepID=A0A9P4UK22_9PEZI|nr:hypothetical protein K431DRAFT_298784 [Polychaeton citri CBS 116435]
MRPGSILPPTVDKKHTAPRLDRHHRRQTASQSPASEIALYVVSGYAYYQPTLHFNRWHKDATGIDGGKLCVYGAQRLGKGETLQTERQITDSSQIVPQTAANYSQAKSTSPPALRASCCPCVALSWEAQIITTSLLVWAALLPFSPTLLFAASRVPSLSLPLLPQPSLYYSFVCLSLHEKSQSPSATSLVETCLCFHGDGAARSLVAPRLPTTSVGWHGYAHASCDPIDNNTVAAASAAANSAFLQKTSSHASLSASAAAAALRSQTASPEPVGSIQTKRMVRRGSQSSVGSGSVIGGSVRGGSSMRGNLQRRGSGGSMTERTFRSPSPGRQSVDGSAWVAADPNAPPVPSLPQEHKRSSSLDIPRRVISPSPAGKAARGSSVDGRGGAAASVASPKGGRPRLSDVPELEREDSSRNINFSRPMSSSNNSPATPTANRASSGGWFTSPTGTGITPTNNRSQRPAGSQGLSAAEKEQVLGSVQAAASKPVKKKALSPAHQGSHLAQASRKSHTPSEPIMVFDSNSRTFVQKSWDEVEQDEPDSPVAQAAAKWDPHTRTLVQPQQPLGQHQDSYAGSEGSDAGYTRRKKRPVLTAVDTDLEPPPRNPARLSPGGQGSSPSSPRSWGFLHKQPSVVREDPEAEDEDVQPARAPRESGTVSTTPSTVKTFKPALATSPDRSVSLNVPPKPDATDANDRGRHSSASPRRSAHFSASPVLEAVKHQPPVRSISPIKSALKQSPATSQRGSSPLPGASGIKSSGSDMGSDDASMASYDGMASGQRKKKKSVRVSFDETPQQLESTSTAVATPTTMHFKSRGLSLDSDEDEDGDVSMKPRPALPSFGSVRKGRVPDVAEKVTGQGPIHDEPTTGPSSDHAVGSILANAQQAPTPPETTSKLARGLDIESSEDEMPKPNKSTAATKQALRAEGLDEIVKAKASADMAPPAINLMPPTPNLEEEETGKEAGGATDATVAPANARENYFAVPGSWAEEEAEANNQASANVRYSQAGPTTPVKATSPLGLTDIGESDSDDSGEFSDAAEDLSDLDGEGFASLNAIIHSPAPGAGKAAEVIDNPVPNVTQGGYDSTTAPAAESPSKGGNVGDWSEATAYWSRLTKQQKQQIEREHLSSDDERPVIPPSATRKVKKTKPRAAPSAQIARPDVAHTEPAPAYAVQGQAPPAIRKSLRSQQPAPSAEENAVHMRKSMRAGGPAGGGGMRASMRDGRPSSSASAASSTGPRARPQSEYHPRDTAMKQHLRANSGSQLTSAGLPVSRPPVQRQDSEETPVSQSSPFPLFARKTDLAPANLQSMKPPPIPNDSDSESSFRKKRRTSVSTMDSQGKYNMKRSMRGGSVDRQQPVRQEQRPASPTPQAKRGSFLRSLSPTGSFMGKKKGRENLKESMRGSSVDAGARTLRSKPATSGMGFGASRPVSSTSGSRFKSRFGDSDGEEDSRGQRSFFKSRFADSDDDEPASPALAPVRGIPRRKGQEDGDSTDLSDEDDYKNRKKQAALVPSESEIEKAMAAARRNLGMTNGTASSAPAVREGHGVEGHALHAGSLRKTDAAPPVDQIVKIDDSPAASPKRKGFMGSILRRNRGSSASVPQSPLAAPQQTPAHDIVRAGDDSIQQSPSTPTAPSSPSTSRLLRRSKPPPAKLERGDSEFSTATAPVQTLNHKDSTNWPLPPALPQINGNVPLTAERPNTSDGNAEPIKLARTMRGGANTLPRSSGQRVVSIHAPDDDANDVVNGKDANGTYSNRTGKKKKFGYLRKAFGLND